MKMPTAFRRPVRRRVPRIELDTPIVPRAVAEGVLEDAGLWLGQPLPRRWVRELTARANTIYAHNPRFRRKIRAKGVRGRDYLWAFARHWLAGLIWERRPHLDALLPSSYSSGHPLPPKPPVPPEAMLRPRRGAVRTPRPAIDRRVRPRARVRPRPDPGYAVGGAAHFHFLGARARQRV